MAEMRKAPLHWKAAGLPAWFCLSTIRRGLRRGGAVITSTAEAVIINATIRDDNGAQIGLQAVALPAMGHTSFAVADRFSVTGGRRGIIEFQNTAGGSIAGLGLRFSPFGSFTSIVYWSV